MKAKKLKNLVEESKVLVIDVREKEEFKKSKDKIKGAKNIPMGRMFLMASLKKLPKKKSMVVTCLYGSRCKIVARELKKKGFKIEHLEGGIKAWKEETKK